MKPFNLEQALAGAPVVTRNGLPIVELKYLATTSKLAVVRKEYDEKLISYFIPCDRKLDETIEYVTNLFMAPTKKEGWVNLYACGEGDVVCSYCVHPSQQEAKDKAEVGIIATIKIEWEE